jgi:hypothetical protein
MQGVLAWFIISYLLLKINEEYKKKKPLWVPAIEQVYKPNQITAESNQTAALGGIILFLKKRRISDM